MKKSFLAFLLAFLALSYSTSPTLAASSKAKLITDTATSANTVPFINAAPAEDGTAATALGVQVGGTERMRVTATGNVGIGTTSPRALLEVNGRIALSGAIYSPSAGNNGNIIIAGDAVASTQTASLTAWGKSATTWGGDVHIISNSSPDTVSGTTRFFTHNGTGWLELMTIKASGNVGIGTTSPSERLDLGGGNIKMGYEKVSTTCSGTNSCEAACSSGKQVIGGGCLRILNGSALEDNSPNGNAWYCHWSNPPTTSSATVICANIR